MFDTGVGENKKIILGKNCKIGDNVIICTNSVIFGDVKLNDGCIIGAGSIVTKDVEANCIVSGERARVIRKI